MTAPKRSLMFRLGQFVGGVARGVTAPLEQRPRSQVVRRDVQQQTRQEGDTTVTLRRTTIEEVEVRPHAPGGTP